MKVYKRFYYKDYTSNGEVYWEKEPRNFYIGNGKDIYRIFRKLVSSGYTSAYYEDELIFDKNQTYILWVDREIMWNDKPTIFYCCDDKFIEIIKRDEVKK